jgi:hypothetical protein
VVVFVHKPTDELVAAATLFVERKHIHMGGIAGHIEDVVVAPQCRGTGIGLRLVSGLKEMGEMLGCYKTILDCREDRVGESEYTLYTCVQLIAVGFYEKCGFVRRGIQMAHYASNLSSSPAVAPAIPPPFTGSSSRQQDSSSNLTLPEIRSVSPLPATVEPAEIDLTSETQSVASSGSGVTYSLPTNTGGFHPTMPDLAEPVAPGGGFVDEKDDISEGELQRPAWANEGLGSEELSGLPVGSGTPISSRPETPLPPGAAPPAHGTEPKRSGTQ